ncbi:hypothetical protein [Aeromonas caviae]
MLVKAIRPTEQVVDVLCDICGDSTTRYEDIHEYATLAATWGYGSTKHDGEQYQLHLCEACFFETLALLRQSHRQHQMFSDDYQPADPDQFGRVN